MATPAICALPARCAWLRFGSSLQHFVITLSLRSISTGRTSSRGPSCASTKSRGTRGWRRTSARAAGSDPRSDVANWSCFANEYPHLPWRAHEVRTCRRWRRALRLSAQGAGCSLHSPIVTRSRACLLCVVTLLGFARNFNKSRTVSLHPSASGRSGRRARRGTRHRSKREAPNEMARQVRWQRDTGNAQRTPGRARRLRAGALAHWRMAALSPALRWWPSAR